MKYHVNMWQKFLSSLFSGIYTDISISTMRKDERVGRKPAKTLEHRCSVKSCKLVSRDFRYFPGMISITNNVKEMSKHVFKRTFSICLTSTLAIGLCWGELLNSLFCTCQVFLNHSTQNNNDHFFLRREIDVLHLIQL